LAAAANYGASIERQLLLLTTRELARLQERVTLLVKSAQERVGEFILEMEKRLAVGNCIELPMKRQDIADYLGLTVETVSRILTSLESCAAIEMPKSRRIVLRGRSALKIAIADRSKIAPSNFPSRINTVRKKSNNGNSVQPPVR
jgi:CRP/FNR family transcriptional regulator, nitrogen fixation regulation protein